MKTISQGNTDFEYKDNPVGFDIDLIKQQVIEERNAPKDIRLFPKSNFDISDINNIKLKTNKDDPDMKFTKKNSDDVFASKLTKPKFRKVQILDGQIVKK